MPKRDDSRVVYVTEAAQQALLAAAAKSHPLETGGILIGVRAEGRPCVTLAIEVTTDDRSERHYRLPAGETKKRVTEARLLDPRVGYLGEWHSHPADVGPSGQDRGAMRALSYVLSSPFPLLIIVRRGESGDYLNVWQSIFFTLQPRNPRLIGDLPPLGD